VLCFFPDKHLEELLNLEERIRRKLAQAAASIGVESEVIPGGATKEVVLSEARSEIEALRRNVATAFQKVVGLSPNLPDELQNIATSITKPGVLADIVTPRQRQHGRRTRQGRTALPPTSRRQSSGVTDRVGPA